MMILKDVFLVIKKFFLFVNYVFNETLITMNDGYSTSL